LNTPLQMFLLMLAGVPKPVSELFARQQRLSGILSHGYPEAA